MGVGKKTIVCTLKKRERERERINGNLSVRMCVYERERESTL